jgi:hypothetical protein
MGGIFRTKPDSPNHHTSIRRVTSPNDVIKKRVPSSDQERNVEEFEHQCSPPGILSHSSCVGADRDEGEEKEPTMTSTTTCFVKQARVINTP